MKKCPKCQSWLGETEYNDNSERKDGFSGYCKSCLKIIRKIHKSKAMSELRKLRDDIKKYGCCLCKEDVLVCIDFHHVNPDSKTDSINSFIINTAKKQMTLELLKTVPVCANCHRKIEHNIIELPDQVIEDFQDFLWTYLIDSKYAKYLQPSMFD